METLEVFRNVGIEHSFTAVEMILLMELGDTEDIYMFPLPEEAEIEDEDYIYAMHDLLQRDFAEVVEDPGKNRGSACRLTEKAILLMEDVFRPRKVVEAISAWEGTLPILIYEGSGPLCTATVWDIKNGNIGVSRVDRGALAEYLEEAGFLPTHPFETVRRGKRALSYDEQMQDKIARVREGLVGCSLEKDLVQWAFLEDVRCVLGAREIPVSGGNNTAKEEMHGAGQTFDENFFVFLDTGTESWILSTPPISLDENPEARCIRLKGTEEWELVPDSLEYRNWVWRCLV